MSANFLPEIHNVTHTEPFRYWCQKVLPLVYDDSLSYYELLCKVVNYLNNAIGDINTLSQDVLNIAHAYTQLESYVNNYFDNLDVQEEINTKLDAMAQDGSLSAIFAQIIPDVVTEWLDENITPTTPPVDDTLTIEDAAADAKATGDQLNLRVKAAATFTGSDIDDIAENSIRYVVAGTDNLPVSTGAFWVETILLDGTSTLSAMQIATAFSNGERYYRRKINGEWQSWNSFVSVNIKTTFTGSDINNITENSWVYVPAGTTNLPLETGAFWVETIFLDGTNTESAIQNAYMFNTGKRYYRRKVQNTWQDWNLFPVVEVLPTFTGTDVNTILSNSFVYVNAGTTNLPKLDGAMWLLTILLDGVNPASAIQMAFSFSFAARFQRRRINNQWLEWVSCDMLRTPASYLAFGDSLTYGAVWLPDGDSYQVTRASVQVQIPTRIASACGCLSDFENHGVSGAYFVGDGNNHIYDEIANTDISNAKLITVAGGRNDSGNLLGTKADAANANTICGQIKKIIEYIQANAPKAQLVWLSVTPNADTNAVVFTKTFGGGWNLNDFDTQVGALCADYDVPYISLHKCGMVHKWASYSGAGGNWSHPNDQDMYVQIGNYFGGQVAAYYSN